jgi:tartrate dehydrogenase/decarboxylase / D-malate dehydrogenase
MLDHLGEPKAARTVLHAIETILSAPNRRLTPDLGGNATTTELGTAIASAI